MLEALIHRIYTRWSLTAGREGRVAFFGIANINYGPSANTARRPPPTMDSQLATLMICATAAAYIYYKRYQNTAISDVPGPKNPSRIFGISHPPCFRRRQLMVSVIGHEWWWQREEAGVIEKRLLDEYGAVVRWNGSLGVRSFSTICRGEILTLTLPTRKNACGSQTPRQFTTFFRVLAICTRDRLS